MGVRKPAAPIAPAEQPEKSRRAPGVEPIFWVATMSVTTAWTMTCPIKLKSRGVE